MGKLKSALVNKLDKVTNNRKADKKKLALSVVSLVLALMVLVSATYCWYVLSNAQAEGNNVSLTVGQGLRVNDLGDDFKRISDNSYLLPASSVDGRNLYFPADGSDFETDTDKMTFRSANAGDRNYDYVQLDFNLTAEANYTGIYIDDENTSIKLKVPDDASTDYRTQCEKAQKAIRAAIYYEKMDKPVVFNAQNIPSSVKAVKDVDRTTGRYIDYQNQVSVPFRNYSYGNHQLAVLNQGETRPFSLIIWLEGTDENCVSNAVMLKQLELNLSFTTSWDHKTTIKFEDKTTNTLVKNFLEAHPGYSLVLNYNDTDKNIEDMKFTMYKSSNYGQNNSNYIWTCNIPSIAYKDLKFQLINDSTKKVEYEWAYTSPGGDPTTNRGTANEYYADTFNNGTYDNINPLSCYGHWHDGDIEDHGVGSDVGDFTDDDW